MKSYDVEWYHHLPPHVKEILSRLRGAGRRAYVVGGAVRDLWRGEEPKDFDLVSEATPEEIEKLFPKTLDVGRAFGIMIVVTEAGPVEVARFRADGAYTDGRHPDEIAFSHPQEDARRRDFTVNALFYDPAEEKVIDYVDGVEDLKLKRLRAVGDPAKRFQEDALRMLRAVRFFAQLGDFSLDEALVRAIPPQARRLALVSRERITQEMLRVLGAKKPSLGLRKLVETALWEAVFRCPPPPPETLDRLGALQGAFTRHFGSPGPALFFTGLEAWVPGLRAEGNFLLAKEERQTIAAARALAPKMQALETLALAEQKGIAVATGFPEAWSLAFAEEPDRQRSLEAFLDWRERKEREGRLNPAPLLRGADLLAIGLKPGPRVKEILGEIRRLQLNEDIDSKEAALKSARERIG
jgi:tRNA nucleotidyltransferase/poly(A) polymerase